MLESISPWLNTSQKLLPVAELARLALFGSGDLGAVIALALSVGTAGVVLILLNIKK